MTYLTLSVSLALVTFLAVHLLASALAALIWRAARRDFDRLRPQARAGAAFRLRVFPAVAALVIVFGVFLPAFFRYEPRETGEMIGRSLVWLAIVSGVLLVRAAWRGWRAVRATRLLVRRWLAGARPIALPGTGMRAYAIGDRFPVVSVVGILRPRVFVSERVLRECTADELAAMVRHERGHLAARDNLKRLLLRACPMPLVIDCVDRALERQWQEASEEAADDYAASASAPSALALANALVRVARMAPARGAALPAASFYEGGSIERRVRRLLGGCQPRTTSRTGWLVVARVLAFAPLLLALAVLVDANLLHSVHHVIEVVVETLPQSGVRQSDPVELRTSS